MKELTIEQKAKAYDEAIERVKKLHETCDSQAVVGWCEYIFSELCESEDDKIRKIILDQMKCWNEEATKENCEIDIEASSKCIAWLEKQGEQKPIDKIQLGKKYKCIASPRYSTFRRGNIYKPVDNFLCNLMNLCYECFEPIEDSEQQPSDDEMKEALQTEYEKGRADAIAEMRKKLSDSKSKRQEVIRFLESLRLKED